MKRGKLACAFSLVDCGSISAEKAAEYEILAAKILSGLVQLTSVSRQEILLFLQLQPAMS